MSETSKSPSLSPADVAAATEQAHVLAQALPFLRRYAGATVVVKYGGHAMGAESVGGKAGAMIRAKKLTRTKIDPESHIERALDLGFVGEPVAVDVRVIHALTGGGLVPVIAPVGIGNDGQTYNINADTVAASVAGA